MSLQRWRNTLSLKRSTISISLPRRANRLTPDSRIAELVHDLDAALHLLHEIVICAFRREHGRDPVIKAEYRAYHRKLYDEACAAMEARMEAPKWLTTDDE
jgi:hypothetical protein